MVQKMSKSDLLRPPAPPGIAGRLHIRVPVPRHIAAWRFRLLFRLATACVAFVTSLVVTAPIELARGWDAPGIGMLVLFSAISCCIVAVGEGLQSRAWESFQRAETQRLDRIAAERLISLTATGPSAAHLAALTRAAPRRRPAQRLFDVVFAALCLVLMSPALALVTILVRLDSRGPFLFHQRTFGVSGRPFERLKFRTMVADVGLQRELLHEFIETYDDRTVRFSGSDPRVTRAGRFLRRTGLDELPALWNVLRGQMSFVGPRPRPFGELTDSPEVTAELLTVRPGFVSPAAVTWAEEGRRDLSGELDYARHATVAQDMFLISRILLRALRTIGNVKLETV